MVLKLFWWFYYFSVFQDQIIIVNYAIQCGVIICLHNLKIVTVKVWIVCYSAHHTFSTQPVCFAKLR